MGLHVYFVRVPIVPSTECQGWGTTIVLGVAGPATVSIPTRSLLTGRCMKGTLYGGYKPKTDVPALVEQYLHKVPLFYT